MNTKKLFLFLSLLGGIGIITSQVKIGSNPTSIGNGQLLELERNGTKAGFKPAAVPLISATDVATVNLTPSTASGTIVYNNGVGGFNPPGLYVWNGTYWSQLSSGNYGDVKTGIQATDHSGWIKMDGRSKSSLTSSQQARATALGIGTNLPDATNSYLVQNGSALGSVSGSNTKTIAQNNLPNQNITTNGTYTPTGTITVPTNSFVYIKSTSTGPFMDFAGSGGVTPELNTTSGGVDLLPTFTGASSAISTTFNLNGNVAQQSLDIKPQSLSVNTFIYLGE